MTGGIVAASVRAVGGTGPDGVVAFNMQGQRVDSTRTCPNLHGLAVARAARSSAAPTACSW
jgi:hypothetical protein